MNSFLHCNAVPVQHHQFHSRELNTRETEQTNKSWSVFIYVYGVAAIRFRTLVVKYQTNKKTLINTNILHIKFKSYLGKKSMKEQKCGNVRIFRSLRFVCKRFSHFHTNSIHLLHEKTCIQARNVPLLQGLTPTSAEVGCHGEWCGASSSIRPDNQEQGIARGTGSWVQRKNKTSGNLSKSKAHYFERSFSGPCRYPRFSAGGAMSSWTPYWSLWFCGNYSRLWNYMTFKCKLM